MSLPQAQIRYTEEEYLALERESEERHEYLDGQIYKLAGESPQHGDICSNLVGILNPQLRGTPCRVWTKDTKVRSGPLPRRRYSNKGLYSFPDLVIVCGEPQFLDEHRDVLINPRVIIEVLSPTTEAFDRGEKFRRYRIYNPSLTDYVVVAQSQPLVEHLALQENGQWVIAGSVSELTDNILIASIGCTLRLAEIYDRIVFEVEEQELAGEDWTDER